MLTWIDLFSNLNYDPQTGAWNWVKKTRLREERGRCDRIRDYKSSHRRRIVKFRKHIYYSPRLAWFYMTGRWPKNEIDHRDGNSENNIWSNLREATAVQNCGNRRGRNGNPFKGASWKTRDKCWVAQITKGGKTYHLGCFKTAEEAHHTYVKAAEEWYGEFARAR